MLGYQKSTTRTAKTTKTTKRRLPKDEESCKLRKERQRKENNQDGHKEINQEDQKGWLEK